VDVRFGHYRFGDYYGTAYVNRGIQPWHLWGPGRHDPLYSYYNWLNLYPAYVRGEAYLAAHQGSEAAAEFAKIVAHRGIVLNEPIGTLVERWSRYVMLVALPDGHTAEAVRVALAAKITTLPGALRQSLTWDQGKEMADHIRFSVDTGVHVYFCDPKSPWQRGSNENSNGLLRQYLPRTTDLAAVTQHDLDQIAASLNGRPRQTLDWLKPSEKFAEAVAMIP
jgi:hypothetical protein